MAYCQAGRCQKCDPVLGVPEEEERREAASQVEIHFSLFCGETKAVHDLCPLGEKLAPVNGQPKYTYGDWAKGWHQYKTDYCSNTVQYVHGVICGRKTVLPTTEYLCPNDPCFLKVQVNFEGPGNDNDESAKMQCSTGKWNIDAHKCVPDQYQEVFITSAFNEENGGTSQTCPPTNVWSGPGYQTFVGGKFEPYWPTWGGASLDGFSGNYLSLATCTGAHCCIGEPMVLGDLDCEDNNWGNGW
jgi:hypothetical protein